MVPGSIPGGRIELPGRNLCHKHPAHLAVCRVFLVLRCDLQFHVEAFLSQAKKG